MSELATILTQIVEKLQQFNPKVRITKYEAEIHKSNAGYGVKLSLIMKDIPIFIKQLREFFYEVNPKERMEEEYLLNT